MCTKFHPSIYSKSDSRYKISLIHKHVHLMVALDEVRGSLRFIMNHPLGTMNIHSRQVCCFVSSSLEITDSDIFHLNPP